MKRCFCAGRPCREGQFHPREAGAIAAAREDCRLSGQSHRGLGQLQAQAIPFKHGRRQQAARFGGGMDQRERPGFRQRSKERRGIIARAMFQPISQEKTFKAARIRGAQRLYRSERRRAIRRPGFWAQNGQPRRRFFGGKEGKRVGFTLLRGGGQQRDRPGFALGGFQNALRGGHAARPIRRCGPAIIQHQQ